MVCTAVSPPKSAPSLHVSSTSRDAKLHIGCYSKGVASRASRGTAVSAPNLSTVRARPPPGGFNGFGGPCACRVHESWEYAQGIYASINRTAEIVSNLHTYITVLPLVA
jgi:hypothetical protein